MVLEDLEAVVERVCDTDPHALADGESVEALHRCLARLEAATTRASAAFDASRAWEADGARSAGAWLARRCGLASSSARRRVRLGRSLRHLPVAEAAWLAGELGEAQVAALARARTPASEAAMERDEQMLVGEASRLRLDSFVRVLAYWSQHADPDGAEDDAATARAARRLHLSQSFEGMWFGDLVLDPVSGAVVSNQLRRIDSELFDADWAEARSRLGEEATRRLHDRVGSDLPSPRGRAAWALLRSLAPTGVKLILVVAVAGGSVADEVGPGLADLRREGPAGGHGPSTRQTLWRRGHSGPRRRVGRVNGGRRHRRL